MPPPRSIQSYPELIFVNRKAGCIRFVEVAKNIPADGLILLVFHGASGQSKTWLLRELARIAKGQDFQNLCVAELNMELSANTDPILLLVHIRNMFARAGVEFTTFEYVLAVYWEKSGRPDAYPCLPGAALSRNKKDISGRAEEGIKQLAQVLFALVSPLPIGGLLLWAGEWFWNSMKLRKLEHALYGVEDLAEASVGESRGSCTVY